LTRKIKSYQKRCAGACPSAHFRADVGCFNFLFGVATLASKIAMLWNVVPETN
jgi:hypothetical protein